jgi:hypothetical protein
MEESILGTHFVGDYGNELIFSDEATKFILMKQNEIKECEEEVTAAENNLRSAKKKLNSSKNCLNSFVSNIEKADK